MNDEKDQGWQMSGFDEALLRAARLQGIKPPGQVFPPEMIQAMSEQKVPYEEVWQQAVNLRKEVERLEQQLAALRARDALLVEREAQAVTLYAQARALLEHIRYELRDHTDESELIAEIRAFLANGGDDGK